LYISSLHLQNFRNYEETQVQFSESSNLILGDNGQGKTNLLEAIFVLCTSKSFRHISDRKLARWGTDEYRISGDFQRDSDASVALALEYRDRKKTLTVNGNLEERISSIIGQVYSVLLSFEDIALVTGPPFERRAFMDLILSTSDRLYFSYLKTYIKVVKQKNRYLSDAARVDTALLAAWNDQIVHTGSYILGKRMELVEFLNRFILEHEEVLKQFSAPLRLEYRPTVKDLSVRSTDEEVRERFDEQLISHMDAELKMGHALYGPHRDDFSFSENKSEIRYFGSVGEARLASIMLKMAQASFYRTVRDVRPIILVDDILLELDNSNRERVLSLFGIDHQILITTTEGTRLTEFFSPDRVFHISNKGKIVWKGMKTPR